MFFPQQVLRNPEKISYANVIDYPNSVLILSCGQANIFAANFSWWHRRLACAAPAKACGYQSNICMQLGIKDCLAEPMPASRENPESTLSNSAPSALSEPLLEVRDLRCHFRLAGAWGGGQTLKAVDQVSFRLFAGETLGLVGESGCGKSTLARLVLDLLKPTRGEVRFAGADVHRLTGPRRQAFKRQMQIIFQDPYSSLNPRMTVRRMLEEPFAIHGLGRRTERQRWVEELLAEVGLGPEHLDRYPHEFSGGQRQRLGIARALALRPRLIVADEPVSALDVSIQAQILNLLTHLQERYGLTYLFISHDLSVISQISTRIAVMYLGRLVDLAPRAVWERGGLHPYAEALLAAIPLPDPGRPFRPPQLKGEPPSPIQIPSGCPFHPRCPEAQLPRCRDETPEFRQTSPEHWVACHFR